MLLTIQSIHRQELDCIKLLDTPWFISPLNWHHPNCLVLLGFINQVMLKGQCDGLYSIGNT
jgi:hypothetical protein